MTKWHGDELPPGLTPDDRVTWPVVATVVIRVVPDPATGASRGLSVDYTGEENFPKIILADQLLLLVRDLMSHDDFQDGVPLRAVRDADEEGDNSA